MQSNDDSASLSTSLAALSVQSHSTTSSTHTHTHTHSHHHSNAAPRHSLAPLPSVPRATPPAAAPLPTFSPLPPTASVRDCLRHFLLVQEQRALAYSAWQSAFRLYIAQHDDERDLLAFTSHCQHATLAFTRLSLQVKLCIAQLQTAGSDEWPPLLQEVQRLEKEKLGLTVGMQELTSEWVVRRKEPFSSELQAQLSVRRERMDEVVEAINDILTEVKYDVNYKKQQP